MTLIEQFSDVQEAYHDRSVDCVVVAENFAIGFADWFHANCYEDQAGYYTASELLETYKKEKGL